MSRIRKYLFRALAIILGLILLLMIVVFSYVSINKQQIIKQVTAELSRQVNGKVVIGDVEMSFLRNFPRLSVLLHHIRITDSLYNQHKHPFFEAEEVFALISITRLLKKEPPLNGLRIDNGRIYLYTDANGYSNTAILRRTNQPGRQPGKKTVLEYIILNNCRLILDDKKKNKFHDLAIRRLATDIDVTDARSVLLDIEADILVHGIAFNRSRGAYLKDKRFRSVFSMKVDRQQHLLQLDTIRFKIDEQEFAGSASFQLAGDAPQFNLRLYTKNIVYDKAKALLTARLQNSLSVVKVNNPVNAAADISGPLKGGTPLVFVYWDTKECRLETPFLDMDEAAFSGYFTNEVVKGMPRNDPNSKIILNNFSANWHGLPVQAKQIELLDLSNPVMSCDIQSAFELPRLNDVIGTNSLQFSSGNAIVNLAFKGPLQNKDSTRPSMNGTIEFKDGTILYEPRNVELQQVNAIMQFDSADVKIENLRAVVLKNKFVMQVMAKNLLTLINTNPGNININWNIYSPDLNLNSFTFLLRPGKKNPKHNYTKKNIVALASKIDNILYNGNLTVALKTDRLEYRKFYGENVLANVSILDDKYIINNAGMDHATGQLNLDGSLVPNGNNKLARLNMAIRNVDVKKLFRSFENFGQDAITEHNLEGRLTAKVNASLLMDENGKVEPSSILSTVDFSLKDGMLNNYEPVKKMQKLVFKKRDFDSIRFAELKNRLYIANREIKMDRMEIQSSAFSMFVEGTYSQRGNTDISIQVPLSNLKKRDDNYIPENIGTDKKGGKSIYLRGRPGSDGNIKFSLDLFKKYEKTK